MHPILIRFGPVTLYSYGLMLVIAFLATIGLARQATRHMPTERAVLSCDEIVDFASWSLLGGILGGRLFYVLLQWEFFREIPSEIPAIWHGGLVWYGGFAGGVFAAWLYVRAKPISMLRAVDQMIPFATLGHAIGRVGCFLNGCCYGRPTQAWWGVVFPGHIDRVIPVQVIEAILLTVLCAVLWRVQSMTTSPARAEPGAGGWRQLVTPAGGVFACYLVGYGLLRFGLEFLRGDQPVWLAGLTLQQVISLVLIAVGIKLLIRQAGGRLAQPRPAVQPSKVRS